MGKKLNTLVALLVGGLGALGVEYTINHHNLDRVLRVNPISKPIENTVSLSDSVNIVESTPNSYPIMPSLNPIKVTKSNQNLNYPITPSPNPSDSVQPEIITDYDSLMVNLENVERDQTIFNRTLVTLRREKNGLNAHVTDRAGANYFVSLFDATKNEPKFLRQMAWSQYFLGDAKRCIGLYKSMDENKNITILTKLMRSRIDVGRKFALEGSNEKLEKQVDRLAQEYQIDR